MDWVDDEARAPTERLGPRESWREPRGELRQSRRGLEERLEHWMTRGRELVDGVSGTRPGTRPLGRGGERLAAGQAGLDGLGRWVEGRLDWLLDDREDWREPWQEGDRSPGASWEASPPPSQRSSRAPLEAISRRVPAAAGPSARPPRREAGGLEQNPPVPLPVQAPGRPPAAAESSPPSPPPEAWPEAETFTVPRWRREEASAQRAATNPLADPAPGSAPGRPLPRSTRRR